MDLASPCQPLYQCWPYQFGNCPTSLTHPLLPLARNFHVKNISLRLLLSFLKLILRTIYLGTIDNWKWDTGKRIQNHKNQNLIGWPQWCWFWAFSGKVENLLLLADERSTNCLISTMICWLITVLWRVWLWFADFKGPLQANKGEKLWQKVCEHWQGVYQNLLVTANEKVLQHTCTLSKFQNVQVAYGWFCTLLLSCRMLAKKSSWVYWCVTVSFQCGFLNHSSFLLG